MSKVVHLSIYLFAIALFSLSAPQAEAVEKRFDFYDFACGSVDSDYCFLVCKQDGCWAVLTGDL